MATELVTINSIQVHCPVEAGEVLIPIKPICEALGIANQKQQEVIKSHPILSSTVTLRVTVGEDGKQREMTCLPLRYAFGWIMGIDARNVKPEAYESVIQYQLACYNALYERFFLEPILQKRKLLTVLEKEAAIKIAEAEKRELTNKITKMKAELEEFKSTSPTEYFIEFPEQEEDKEEE